MSAVWIESFAKLFSISGGALFVFSLLGFLSPDIGSSSSPFETFRERIVHGTGKLAAQLARFFAFFVGSRWGDFSTSIRLVAAYWIFGPTIYFLLPVAIESGPSFVSNSFWAIATAHVWLWSNIATDYVSFNVTRSILRTYSNVSQSRPGPTAGFSFKLFIVDFAVGFLMLAFAIIGTNTAYLFFVNQDFSMILANFWKTVFGYQTIFKPFGLIKDAQVTNAVPAMFYVAVTTFIPTAFAVVGMMATSMLLFAAHLLLYVGRQHERLQHLLGYTDKAAWLRACLGGAVTGVVLLGTGIALLK